MFSHPHSGTMGGAVRNFGGGQPKPSPSPKEMGEVGIKNSPQPLMLDVFSGPNTPLAKAFEWCGWRTISFDRKIQNPSEKARNFDLSSSEGQQELEKESKEAAFMAVAFDCSTKSRIREIVRVAHYSSGKPRQLPTPLRSEEFPEGLPSLEGKDLQRVQMDNFVTEFVLNLISEHAERGGGSLRENPSRSLHWWLPQEVQMMMSGTWDDTLYTACVLMAARAKKQRLRHNIAEIAQWPDMTCRHVHNNKEWTVDWKDELASHVEAEYTACLVFYIAVSVSWWAIRLGKARMKIYRLPHISSTGDRRGWERMDPRVVREFAMLPTALEIGISLRDAPNAIISADIKRHLPIRRNAKDAGICTVGGKPARLEAYQIYVGKGHHSHRLPTTKWACPFVAGQDGSHEDCMLWYIQHLQEGPLQSQLQELYGKELVCDCPMGQSCEADILIAKCACKLSSKQRR